MNVLVEEDFAAASPPRWAATSAATRSTTPAAGISIPSGSPRSRRGTGGAPLGGPRWPRSGCCKGLTRHRHRQLLPLLVFRPAAQLPLLHDRIERRRERGRAEGRRRRDRGRARREGGVGGHVRAPEQRPPGGPRPGAGRALRARAQGRGRRARGVQLMPTKDLRSRTGSSTWASITSPSTTSSTIRSTSRAISRARSAGSASRRSSTRWSTARSSSGREPSRARSSRAWSPSWTRCAPSTTSRASAPSPSSASSAR